MLARKQKIKEELHADLFFSVPLQSVHLNEKLPYPIYVIVGGQYVLFRNVGDEVSTDRVESLSKNITCCYIKKEYWNQYIQNLESKAVHESGSIGEAHHIRNLLIAHQQITFALSPEDVGPEEIKKISHVGEDLAVHLFHHHDHAKTLIQKYTEAELYHSNHNINTLVFSIAMALKLDFSATKIQALAKAVITHNIGNLFIPSEILLKDTPLSNSEWELIKQHPIKGAALLAKLKAPKESILTALQHHERYDGLGYPNKVQGSQIHIFAKICSVADVFDSLTTSVPQREALSAKEAIEKMRAMNGKFDPSIIQMLEPS